MRNMTLLESFIIFFEASTASLCNLQHFFLLLGIFWMQEQSSRSPSEY